MSPSDVSPRAEPVAWSTAVGLIVAVAISYGLDVTPELDKALAVLAPIALAALWARFRVWAPDTVEDVVEEAHEAGRLDLPAPEV